MKPLLDEALNIIDRSMAIRSKEQEEGGLEDHPKNSASMLKGAVKMVSLSRHGATMSSNYS
jgi:hypothetical protein